MPQPNLPSPFRPAVKVEPRVKCLVFGPPGIGKTYFALGAPGPIAVIDTEGGTAFYAGRKGLSKFDVLPTKTYRDVKAAVEYLAEHPGAYPTLVIDPVTVIYETLQDAAQVKRAVRRNDPDADLEMLDWGRIKRQYKSLMTALVNLPTHVIVTAREKDETEKRGSDMVKIGVKADAEKGTPYWFDIIVHLVPAPGGREAVIAKDRTGTHELAAHVENPTFTGLFGAILAGKGTEARHLQDDGEAAAIDAEEELAGARLSSAIVSALRKAKKDPAALLKRKGWANFASIPAATAREVLAWAVSQGPPEEQPTEEPAEQPAESGEAA
jgi:hypothetical protein